MMVAGKRGISSMVTADPRTWLVFFGSADLLLFALTLKAGDKP